MVFLAELLGLTTAADLPATQVCPALAGITLQLRRLAYRGEMADAVALAVALEAPLVTAMPVSHGHPYSAVSNWSAVEIARHAGQVAFGGDQG